MNNNQQKINFFNYNKQDCPLSKQEINFLCGLIPEVKDVSVAFLSPEEMQEINLSFNKKNKPTDVLSFPDLEHQAGEILFCAEEIFKYSQENGLPPSVRWAHLFIHSMIHLRGFDHETDEDARAMFDIESKAWQEAKSFLKTSWNFNDNYEYYQD